jgi:hypothetical protein
MPGRTIISFLSLFLPLSVICQTVPADPGKLALQSDLVVVGTVGSRTSEWNADRSRIQTRVTISVNETIKGGSVPPTVEVVVPGGEIDGVGEWYSHTTRFDKNEDVVVFAKKDSRGEYGVAGGTAGKITIAQDPVTGRKLIPRFGSLQEFTSSLRKSVLSQQEQSIKK